jgi:hypothetical protein
VIFRAAAALPDDDRQRAVDELRSQLCTMAVAAAATPDWTTLTLTGPIEMAGADEEARFEWTASVAVDGGVDAPCAEGSGPACPRSVDSDVTRPMPTVP